MMFTFNRVETPCCLLALLLVACSGCMSEDYVVAQLEFRGASVHRQSPVIGDPSRDRREYPTSVDFRDVEVTDADLRYVGQLRRLKHLRIWNSKVTDAGLAYLAGLGELQSLTIRGGDISDEGIEDLRHLRALRFITIESPRLSSQAANRLAGLPRLKSVQFNGMQLGRFRVAALREAESRARPESEWMQLVRSQINLWGFVIFVLTFGLLFFTQVPIHLPGFRLCWLPQRDGKRRTALPAVLALLILVVALGVAWTDFPGFQPSSRSWLAYRFVEVSWGTIRFTLLATGVASVGQSVLHLMYAIPWQGRKLITNMARMRRISRQCRNRGLRRTILLAYAGAAAFWGWAAAWILGFEAPPWLLPLAVIVTSGKMVEHTLPPYVLLLGSSEEMQVQLQHRLRAVLFPHRVVSLLVERRDQYSYSGSLYHESDCFRTDQINSAPGGQENWKIVLVQLADTSHLVVIDTRVMTQHVHFETMLTLNNYSERAVFLMPPATPVDYLESAVAAGQLEQSSLVATESDLFQRVAA